MIQDVSAVIRKEWLEFFRQDESKFSGVARLGVLAVLGLTVAQAVGPDFGRSSLTPVISAFLASVFILPVVSDSFAGEREHHTLETLLASRISDRGLLMGKIMANVLYGWSIAIAVTGAGVVLAVLRGGGVDARVLLAAAGASLLAAALTTVVGVLVSLSVPTVKQATQTMGLILVAITAVPFLVGELIPPEWTEAFEGHVPTEVTPEVVFLGVVQVFVLIAILTAVAYSRFQRDRLVQH